MLAPILDDAHLMDLANLRKLRLLFEDFPKNHNLVLIGQPGAAHVALRSARNHDIKCRVTYSVITPASRPTTWRASSSANSTASATAHATFTARGLRPHRPLLRRRTCAAPATSASAA